MITLGHTESDDENRRSSSPPSLPPLPKSKSPQPSFHSGMSRSLSVVSLEERNKDRYVLRTVLAQHRPEVVRQLEAEKQGFLGYLVTHRLLEQLEVEIILSVSPRMEQNHHVLDCVAKRSTVVSDSYGKFIDALHRSGQSELAGLLTSVDRELEVVAQYRDNLSHHLTDIDAYLKKESRRAQIQFSTQSPPPSPTPYQHPPNTAAEKESMTSFLYKVHQTTKNTVVQFDRCREVIEKLHRDCNEVAGRNADMVGKLRECHELVKDVVPDVSYSAEASDSAAANMSLVPAPQHSARTLTDESETIMSSIRSRLGRMDQILHSVDDDHEATRFVLQAILQDIKERKRLLDRMIKPLAVDERKNIKYLNQLVPANPSQQLMMINHQLPLRDTAEDLARQVFVYMDQERQLSVRASDGGGAKQGPVRHRDFDEVDKDLYYLKREVKRNKDPQATQAFVSHVVESTRAERNDCLKLVAHIEKTIRVRRSELMQKEKTDDKKTKKKQRKANQPKSRRLRTSAPQTNFSKKLVQLEHELQAYMHLDQDQKENRKSELNDQKSELENETRKKAQQIFELEKQVQEVEREKERYKALYVQEKDLRSSKLLTRPVMVSRQHAAMKPPGKPAGRQKPKFTSRGKQLTHLREQRAFGDGRKEARVRPTMRMRSESPALKIAPIRPHKASRDVHVELPLLSESSFKM